jgi:imidazolonepropionase-like amidohydrolase
LRDYTACITAVNNRSCMNSSRAFLARLFVALALVTAIGSNLHAQFGGAVANELVITGGWLFDATDDQRRPNTGIVIRDGKFITVGLGAGVALPDTATTIELDNDQTILPGMFDLHAHYNYNLVDQGRVEEVEYTGMVFLANGVTATWPAGEYYPERVLAQRDLIDRGQAVGPRLFASGPYMGGFRCEYAIKTAADECAGWPNEITEAEMRAEVDYWADQGVLSIKIKQATAHEARILIDQAQQRGLTTAGHLYNYETTYDVDARDAIRMGLDRLEHNMTLGSGGPRSAELDEVIELLLEHQVFFDANLQMYGGINLRKELPGMLWTNEEQYFTPYTQMLLQKRGPPLPESEPADFNQRLVELRKLYAAGGANLLIVGTDEPVYTSLLAGFAYHRELMAMVYAGISPADVLRAATINGARALGVADRLGTIEPGKLADFVVVQGNPLGDITAARNVELVVKDGKVYRPEELLSSVVGKIGPRGPDDHADWILEVRDFPDYTQ